AGRGLGPRAAPTQRASGFAGGGADALDEGVDELPVEDGGAPPILDGGVVVEGPGEDLLDVAEPFEDADLLEEAGDGLAHAAGGAGEEGREAELAEVGVEVGGLDEDVGELGAGLALALGVDAEELAQHVAEEAAAGHGHGQLLDVVGAVSGRGGGGGDLAAGV